LRPAAIDLSEDLIDARPRLDFATGREGRPGEQVARLRAVNVPLESFFVVEAADEDHFLAEVAKRIQHFAELHVLSRPLGPPMILVKAVAGEEGREPQRSIAAGRLRFLRAPDGERFHPWQSHRDAEAFEEDTTGGRGESHGRLRGLVLRFY